MYIYCPQWHKIVETFQLLFLHDFPDTVLSSEILRQKISHLPEVDNKISLLESFLTEYIISLPERIMSAYLFDLVYIIVDFW